jgi:hypothetical protein
MALLGKMRGRARFPLATCKVSRWRGKAESQWPPRPWRGWGSTSHSDSCAVQEGLVMLTVITTTGDQVKAQETPIGAGTAIRSFE